MRTVSDEIVQWNSTLDHLQKRIKAAKDDIKAIIEKAREIKNLTGAEADLALLMIAMIDVTDTQQENAASASAITENIKRNAGESSQQTFGEIETEIRNERVRELVGR